jgi:hypothetical protein
MNGVLLLYLCQRGRRVRRARGVRRPRRPHGSAGAQRQSSIYACASVTRRARQQQHAGPPLLPSDLLGRDVRVPHHRHARGDHMGRVQPPGDPARGREFAGWEHLRAHHTPNPPDRPGFCAGDDAWGAFLIALPSRRGAHSHHHRSVPHAPVEDDSHYEKNGADQQPAGMAGCIPSSPCSESPGSRGEEAPRLHDCKIFRKVQYEGRPSATLVRCTLGLDELSTWEAHPPGGRYACGGPHTAGVRRCS